ncbi:MAG: hypothetical protein WC670_04110 [Pseudolabrys sp.]|jgi:hypothetical protein
MNEPDILNTARHQLADAVSKTRPFAFEPLNISPWLAAALLQKAIRRGEEALALRATATLLKTDPARLWRRCCGTAFEDIGIVDIDTVSVIRAALTGKRFRARLGGEWHVASYIVSRMARAPKCRSSDDLLMAVEFHPGLETARREFPRKTTSALLGLSTGVAPLLERALAMWFALGTNRWNSRHLLPRRGEPQFVFDHLLDQGYPTVIVDLAREGFRKGAGMLAPFVALLFPLNRTVTATEDDVLPPEIMIGDVPSWAFDIYSREGRASLETFLNGRSATAIWIRTHMPPAQRLRFLGGVLFRAEGGLVRKRVRWDVGDKLRRAMDIECHGRHCPDATEILALLSRDIPLLNEVRAHV